ncbi:hypothetical protein VHUM_00983 [Vanrija humicola]|uniref:CHCH domain-containing protein n=1 Tax=Vanrija humicola TaxID=5417 RepID=A0A7D8Z9M9_VANHU|nr:hypothetical protein VHUM_00983 [Vanrija humicola]
MYRPCSGRWTLLPPRCRLTTRGGGHSATASLTADISSNPHSANDNVHPIFCCHLTHNKQHLQPQCLALYVAADSSGPAAPANASQSGRSSSRPTARPAPAAAPAGTRSASTAAYPAQTHQAPPAAYPTQQKQPGLLAQAASTMGGAVAGSVVGHGISNMLFGGSRPAEQAPPPAEYAQQQQQQAAGASCDIQAKDFTKCLEATNGDMNSCSYYLEALKACQSAARPY